jgi:TM2 domain-containing membrane protein YozV
MQMHVHKSVVLAYLLWFFSGFGWLGLHRIYLHKYKTCAIWTLTFGLFGVGSVIDFFTLHWMVKRFNSIAQIRSIRQQLHWIRLQKQGFIDAGRYEEAAGCRDEEMKLEKRIQLLKSALQHNS